MSQFADLYHTEGTQQEPNNSASTRAQGSHRETHKKKRKTKIEEEAENKKSLLVRDLSSSPLIEDGV